MRKVLCLHSHTQIIPYAYQPKLSAHLRNLRRDKVITDVDPSEPIDCILNVTICEKKTEGEIRMNIDMRPMNTGSKHTKHHIPLPPEMWKRSQIRKRWKRAFSGGSGSGSSKIFASSHHLLLMTKKVPKAKFCQHFLLYQPKKQCQSI